MCDYKYWISTYITTQLDSNSEPEYRRRPPEPLCLFFRAVIHHTEEEARLDYVNEFSRLDIQENVSKTEKCRI